MEFDWHLILTALGFAATIYANVRSTAKSEERTQGKIELLENEQKHTNENVSELREEVHKYNQLKDRMSKAEGRLEVLDEKQDVANHRISDLESESQSDIREIKNKLINMTRRI